MEELENFLIKLDNGFKKLASLFCNILKEEKKIEEDILIKEGFIIKSWSLNYSKIDLSQLDKLLSELERILNLEVDLQEQLVQHKEALDKTEYEYNKITEKRLHSELLQKDIKEFFHYSTLMINRIAQLKRMLEEGLKLHPKTLGKDTEIFFASFEHITNKILRFIHFLEQLTERIISFEREAYYPEPRTYGRIMSYREVDKTAKTSCLSSSQNPTPVFDSPSSVMEKLLMMSRDERKNLFKLIGVRRADKILFFKTKLKPINHDRPVVQSNGLREYKFPKGIKIEILKAA